MMRSTVWVLTSGLLALAAGCGGGDGGPTDGGPTDGGPDAVPSDGGVDAPGFFTSIPVDLNRDVDVLFLVDNSGSMLAEQQALAAGFPAFINALQSVAGGLPNLHLGVLSSNVGASGAASVPGCSGVGDDGNLLTGPPLSTCASQFGLQGTFIANLAAPDGTRTINYNAGQLAPLFSCMASLGTGGCGFEQHLESMYRSLQPGKNPGFLRASAHLAVVILADEDDCSTQMATMFGDPNAGLTSQLGPRTSFRCHEFGVRCDNDPNPRAFGTKTGCVSNPNSQYMYEVDRYVDFMHGLKTGAAQVIVTGILGNFDEQTREVVVGPDPNNPSFPSVQKSCFTLDPNDPDDGAAPPVRLAGFLSAFPGRNVRTSICNANLSAALVAVATEIKDAIGSPCIDADLGDADPVLPGIQPECTVKDVIDPSGPGRTETPIAACAQVIQSSATCDPGGVATPCWCLHVDTQSCPSAPGNLALGVARGGAPPAGTVVELYCRTD